MDLSHPIDAASLLVCPSTRLALSHMLRADAELKMGGVLKPRPDLKNAKGGLSKAAGVTETVLVREDNKLAYPVVDGIPVLLVPESLTLKSESSAFDLTDPRYAEAYEEMEFYNDRASDVFLKLENEGANGIMPRELSASAEERRSFPAPRWIWVDGTHDGAAQWDGYSFLGPLDGQRVLQIGGSGTHAVKFALAGASETWLVTPIFGEAVFARQLADSAGVGERFNCAVGIAEELPLRSDSWDAIFAGGCLHHTVTSLSLPEAARVLRPGGKFAAVEPWRAPLYEIGTKFLGKREDAYCRPIDSKRIEPINGTFKTFSLLRHGTITRYPLIALDKFGLPIHRAVSWYIGKIDDAVSSLIPGFRGMGSSIAILASK